MDSSDSRSDDAAAPFAPTLAPTRADLIEISEKWGLTLTRADSTLTTDDLWAQVIEELARRVELLMDRDARKFSNDLYRLDVSEARIKQVMRGGGDVFSGLARIILERELQKARTRREYVRKD